MNKLRCVGLALVAFVASAVGALAQTTDPVETAMESVQTALEGYITAALPIIGAVAVAGLGLWALPKFVRWVKSALGR